MLRGKSAEEQKAELARRSERLSALSEDDVKRAMKKRSEVSPFALAVFGAIIIAVILAIIAILWWGR
jgi:type II secretory pathway component PulF